MLNVAFYHFTHLDEPAELRRRWESSFTQLELKGTVILAREGVNGFLAGTEAAIRDALGLIQADARFTGLRWKESTSPEIPFRHLAFKLKEEIVTFREPSVSPPPAAPRLAPAELRRWYESGKDFVILDTRNEYEFRLGHFAGAISAGLEHFVDFREAAKRLPEEWKEKPLVTYCTGGIRCEKAAPYLAQLGFRNVYQLDDGILGYLEREGGAHWEGECFVFDERIALDATLRATGATLCPKCQGPNAAVDVNCRHCGSARQ